MITTLWNLSCVSVNDEGVVYRQEQEVEDVLISLANIALCTEPVVQPSRLVMAISTSMLYWTVPESTLPIDFFTLHKLTLEFL